MLKGSGTEQDESITNLRLNGLLLDLDLLNGHVRIHGCSLLHFSRNGMRLRMIHRADEERMMLRT